MSLEDTKRTMWNEALAEVDALVTAEDYYGFAPLHTEVDRTGLRHNVRASRMPYSWSTYVWFEGRQGKARGKRVHFFKSTHTKDGGKMVVPCYTTDTARWQLKGRGAMNQRGHWYSEKYKTVAEEFWTTAESLTIVKDTRWLELRTILATISYATKLWNLLGYCNYKHANVPKEHEDLWWTLNPILCMKQNELFEHKRPF